MTDMELKQALRTRRSIRKFKREKIKTEVLRELIDDARLAPSGANLQPVKYIAVNKPDICEKLFANIKWAGYTAPLGVPGKDEAPAAYIAVIVDKTIRENGDNDASYAESNIVLSAWDKGIGSCIIGAFIKKEADKILTIGDTEYIHNLVALGYPAQESVYEDNDETVKYYLDENGNFHVPKRTADKVGDFGYCE